MSRAVRVAVVQVAPVAVWPVNDIHQLASRHHPATITVFDLFEAIMKKERR